MGLEIVPGPAKGRAYPAAGSPAAPGRLLACLACPGAILSPDLACPTQLEGSLAAPLVCLRAFGSPVTLSVGGQSPPTP